MARPLKIKLRKRPKPRGAAHSSTGKNIRFRLITLYDLIYHRGKKESYSATLKKLDLDLPGCS